MVITLIIIVSILLLVIGRLTFLYTKSIKSNSTYKQEVIKKLEDLKSEQRNGYFKSSLTFTDHKKNDKVISFDFNVFVVELKRYSNGESECSFEKIEMLTNVENLTKQEVHSFVYDNFTSLKKTSDITWLEEYHSVLEERSRKITKIVNNIKNNEII